MKNKRLKKALITGASGFIGSNLVKRLVEDNWAVSIIVRPTSDLRKLQSVMKNITVYVHDGGTENLCNIVKKSNPDIVFHLATYYRGEHIDKDIVPMIESNITFGVQLLDAMAKNNVKLLVNTETSWQHYKDKKYCPVCLYASTKQAFNDILEFYIDSCLIKAVTLTFFNVYGKGESSKKLFPMLLDALKSNKCLEMTDGKQILNYINVSDAVMAYMVAAKRLFRKKVKSHENFGVFGKESFELRKIIEVFNKVSTKRLDILWGKKLYRTREVMMPWRKCVKLPGWSAKVKLKQGIRELITNQV